MLPKQPSLFKLNLHYIHTRMKTVQDTLLGRRSIRRYERRKIEPEKLDFIYQAIRNTPTSYNGQQFSVIAINDQETKEKIYGFTQQKQIKTCSTFLVFCLDYHKLEIGGAMRGVQAPCSERTMNGYTVGVIDASMAMMSAVVAAESMGLGCCCIGYARTADPKLLSEILGLPKGVSIVCGLTLGYPAETPDLKPKLPLSLVVHQERYTADEEMCAPLREYEEEVIEYNHNRSGGQTNNDWSTHILDYHRHSMEQGIEGYLHDQLGCGEKQE